MQRGRLEMARYGNHKVILGDGLVDGDVRHCVVGRLRGGKIQSRRCHDNNDSTQAKRAPWRKTDEGLLP
jgi:hypothetical protein